MEPNPQIASPKPLVQTQPNMFAGSLPFAPSISTGSMPNAAATTVGAESSADSNSSSNLPSGSALQLVPQQVLQVPFGASAQMPPAPVSTVQVSPQPMITANPQPPTVYQPNAPAVSSQTNNAAAHPRNVYVASLPLDFTDAQLEQMFSPFGRVLSAKVQYDHKTKMGKGYGFILYDNPASADLAVQNMMSAVVNGQRIQVRKAKANTKTSINAAANTQPTPMLLQQPQQPQQIILQQQPQQLLTTQQGQLVQLASPAPMMVQANPMFQQQVGSPALVAGAQVQQQVVFAQAPQPQSMVSPQDSNTSLAGPNVAHRIQQQPPEMPSHILTSSQPAQAGFVSKPSIPQPGTQPGNFN